MEKVVQFIFPFAVGSFFATLLTFAFIYLARRRKVSNSSLTDLIERLRPVPRDNLARVAADAEIELSNEELADDLLDRDAIWDLVGGLAGIEVLDANCSVLIDLACHLQQWYPEALSVAEQLRLNAGEIQWHLHRLRGAALTGHLHSAFPDYARRAVAVYCTMSEQLLQLCKATDETIYSQLMRAI